MTAPATERPWYCRDGVVDEYKQTLTTGGERLPMLKALKIIRAIIVNIGIIAIGGYSLFLGGDPTLLGITVLIVGGAYNGLEFSDYTALLQAYQEVQAQTDTTDDGQD
jgi:hypothetical protein